MSFLLRSRRAAAALAALLCLGTAPAQEPASASQPTSRPAEQPTSQPTSGPASKPVADPKSLPPGFLELISGERLSGRLDVESESQEFRWRSDAFEAPIAFPVEALYRIVFPPAQGFDEPSGMFRIVLTNGDTIFGDLMQIGADAIVVETARHGRLEIARSELASLHSRRSGAVAYEGPNGLPQWTARQGVDEITKSWSPSGDDLEAARAGAPLARLGLIATGSSVRIGLAWNGAPTFRARLGIGADAAGDAASVQIETWGETLVAFRETADRVEIVELQPKLKPDTELEVIATVTDDAFVFQAADGKELGRLARQKSDGDGVQIENLGSTKLRLTRVAVRRLLAASADRHETVDAAEILGIDDGGRLVRSSGAAADLKDIREIRFGKDPVIVPAPVVFALQDGTVARGVFAGLEALAIRLQVPWSRTPLRMPTEAGHTMLFGGEREKRSLDKRRLAVGSNVVRGAVAGFDAEKGAILWKLMHGRVPALLDAKKSFRMTLNEVSAFAFARGAYPHRIHFIDNDCAPCRIVSIDAKTVVFESYFGKRRVESPIDAIKAVEFDAQRVRAQIDDQRIPEKPVNDNRGWIPPSERGPKPEERNRIDKDRREVILAQPRKYKSKPPTHLFIARNADVLRGNLAAFGESTVEVASGLADPVALPRESLIAIVFLRPGLEAPASQPADKKSWRVELKLDKEFRVSGMVLGATETALRLLSPHFGEIEVPFEDVLEITGGDECGRAPGFFTGWVLKPMKEPPN